MIDADTAGEIACGLTPVRVLLVVDDVLGTELPESLGLFDRGCGCDYSSAGGFGELSTLSMLSSST